MKRAIAVALFVHRFAATSSALLSTPTGVGFPEQAAVAAIEPPAVCGPASSPPRLPRGGGVRGRRMLVLLGVIGIALLGGGAWAFWSAGSAPGASAQGVAASVDQVTGLALGGDGVTPTADPDVALAWNDALLSNGHAIDGYLVRRYVGSTPTPVCGSVTATHCTDAAVPDGTYTYGVSATFDSWTGPESSRIAVTVDTSAPAIDSAPQSPSANGSPSFTFSDATYSHFKCRLDGAASFTTCTSPDALSGLGDGSHTFRVEAVDANGVATHVAAHTWTIDTSPPTLGSTPSDPSANTAPSFGFSHGSYGSFDCSVDGSVPTPCSSSDPLGPLGSGPHTFQVEAIDGDGVTTPAAAYTWTVDASAPSFTARPTSPSANPSPSFAFAHAQAAYTFRCNLDGAGYGGCSSPLSPGTLPEGSHELDVEAVGADGVATPPAVYHWTIDTSPPTITSTSGMVAGQTYASQSASFTLSHPSYSSFQCFLDGGSFAACGGGAATGLWPSSFQATPTNCGSFGQDANNFCYIHDSSVELGVKFTAASPLDVVGVRIYRVDAGDVTASLWSSDGTGLAGPTSFGGSATHGWQDVMFDTPVPIAAGQTYVASYFAPSGDYPFQWFFFTSSPWTVGPITALQSAGGDPNGVYCYGGASCFPTDSFQDTNYWVTPLWTDASGGSATYGACRTACTRSRRRRSTATATRRTTPRSRGRSSTPRRRSRAHLTLSRARRAPTSTSPRRRTGTSRANSTPAASLSATVAPQATRA